MHVTTDMKLHEVEHFAGNRLDQAWQRATKVGSEGAALKTDRIDLMVYTVPSFKHKEKSYCVSLRNHKKHCLCSCDCPDFEDRSQVDKLVCKHVWYVLLFGMEGSLAMQPFCDIIAKNISAPLKNKLGSIQHLLRPSTLQALRSSSLDGSLSPAKLERTNASTPNDEDTDYERENALTQPMVNPDEPLSPTKAPAVKKLVFAGKMLHVVPNGGPEAIKILRHLIRQNGGRLASAPDPKVEYVVNSASHPLDDSEIADIRRLLEQCAPAAVVVRGEWIRACLNNTPPPLPPTGRYVLDF